MGKINWSNVGNAIMSSLPFVGSHFDRKHAKKQNEEQRQHEMAMYNMQRQDALSDWDRVTQYNSPEQQMERLRQAGLNPHLVYGKGADATAQAIKSPSYNQGTRVSERGDFGGSAEAAFRVMQSNQMRQQSKVTTDALNADIALKKKEEMLKDLEIARKGIDNKSSQRAYELGIKLEDSTLRAAEADARLREFNAENAQQREYRAIAKDAASVKSAWAEILYKEQLTAKTKQEKEQIGELRKIVLQDKAIDLKLKQEELRLMEAGIYPGDPVWMREIAKVILQNIPEGKSPGEAMEDWFKRKFIPFH